MNLHDEALRRRTERERFFTDKSMTDNRVVSVCVNSVTFPLSLFLDPAEPQRAGTYSLF